MIKLGVLDCGELPAEIVDDYGTFAQWFEQFLGLASESIEFCAYNAWDHQLPLSADECDAYLITGSADSVYDDIEWLNALKGFIRESVTQVPYVGICFGHQLLHQLLGGLVERSDKGWCIGTHHYRVHQKLAWMQPSADSFELLASHQDQVIEAAPGALTLASSASCPVAMSAFADYAISLQPHPELQRDAADYIFKARRDEQGHQLTDTALASLQQPLSDSLAAQWIVNFLELSCNKNSL